MTDLVLGLADNNGEENRTGEGLKAVVRSQGLKAAGPPGRWEPSPGPYKMHVSSPDFTCVALGRGLAGVGVDLRLQMVKALLTSPLLLSCFPSLPRPPPTLLQAPEQRRKQSPRLASPRWPRRGWRSSRIAVGPRSAASCSPQRGAPGGTGTPSHPLVFRAPISPGPRSSPRQKGLKASP